MLRSTPIIWCKWFEKFFETDAKFACKIWRAFDASPTVLYQLSLVETTEAPLEIWRLRMKRLYALISPQDLLAASLRVSGETLETSKLRLPQAVRFEEAVLQWVDKGGQWII